MSNESQTHVEASEEELDQGMVSRRRLLKTILATGGAVAASTLLPNKWAEPVVEVGLLPAHAQVTEPTEEPTEEPTIYAPQCNADPQGGGAIVLENGAGAVQNITATIQLLSGTGPVAGIVVTMSAVSADSYPFPSSFLPLLPRDATTDGAGVASFGDQTVFGVDGDSFNLRFDYVDPVNSTPDNCVCGRYDLVEVE